MVIHTIVPVIHNVDGMSEIRNTKTPRHAYDEGIHRRVSGQPWCTKEQVERVGGRGKKHHASWPVQDGGKYLRKLHRAAWH
jgi:hypothetical protein